MNTAWLDTRLRLWREGSRRGVIRLLGGGVAALLSRFEPEAARSRKRDKKRKKKPPKPAFTFDLVRSEAVEAANCLPQAGGRGRIFRLGTEAERLELSIFGLPPGEEFEVFITQVPDEPFGLSWYLGDIDTNAQGQGEGTFIGRFNKTTAIVSPGAAAAPVVHTTQPFPDRANNNGLVFTNPVHTFHVGLWFDSANDALEVGCDDDTETPFSGIHRGGIQALSTRNFAAGDGPLGRV